MSDFPFKNLCNLPEHVKTIQKNVWEKSNDAYSLSIRVQTTIQHFNLSFTTISTSKKMLFSEWELKKSIARHIEVSSMVQTLIDNSKFANHIVRLAAILVKYELEISKAKSTITSLEIEIEQFIYFFIYSNYSTLIIQILIYKL